MNKLSIQKQARKLAQKINQPQQFTKELEILLESLGDEEATASYRRIIPEMGKTFGVPKPALDIIAQEISKAGERNPETTLELLKTLWQKGTFEGRTITAKALGRIGKKAPEKSLNLTKSFLQDIDNWSICDVLATQGLRGIIASHKDEILDLALGCIKDKNKWIKRFGVVTIVELAHNKKLEIPRGVFDIIAPLMTAGDSDIKKAVAWALREISKREPDVVKGFLKNYQDSQNKNIQWIVREGSKKL